MLHEKGMAVQGIAECLAVPGNKEGHKEKFDVSSECSPLSVTPQLGKPV